MQDDLDNGEYDVDELVKELNRDCHVYKERVKVLEAENARLRLAVEEAMNYFGSIKAATDMDRMLRYYHLFRTALTESEARSE